MVKFSSLLQQRFRKKEKTNKMADLAERSTSGELSSFAGVFGMRKPEFEEREALAALLQKFSPVEGDTFSQDLTALLAITSEVKAINNQAAILHGERIQRAQQILKSYREGAFTAWLIATYGNRQTPYNFLQYYTFYSKMPKKLHPQIESMPRQAIYTLASRDGQIEKKEEIVRNYNGETKQQLVSLIRAVFPLKENDKRRGNVGAGAISNLERVISMFETEAVQLSERQKKNLESQVKHLASLIEKCKTT